MKRWFVVVVFLGCHSREPQPPVAGQGTSLCSGQTPGSIAAATTPREGPTELQLAPSLLDRMTACTKRDATPAAALARATAGTVNAKGDCEWGNGVKCHYHLGAEFV